jgi:hypothetical protein
MILKKIFYFYYDGFREMTVGRKLWIIILVKLVVIFIVFRIFFFQDFLDSRFDTRQEKSDYVIDDLTKNAD